MNARYIIQKSHLSSTCRSNNTQQLISSPKRIVGRRASSSPLKIRATSWDPEGLFKGSAPAPGMIDRKLMQQRIGSDQQATEQVAAFIAAQKADIQAKREARVVPEDPHDLIEFFLDTEGPDMEFEVARCRPKLDKTFFGTLDKLVGVERFSTVPDEDRLAELETLRDYLTEATEAIDNATKAVIAAPERVKKLLGAKDKKAMLLEMAGAGEIDTALMDLLEQNIEGAKAAGQEAAAEFMTKVRQAAAKYYIKT